MLSGIIEGATAYVSAFKIIRQYSLWKYVILSGLISALFGFAIFYSIWQSADYVGDWLGSFYSWDFGKSIFDRVIDYFAGGVMIVLALLLYKYVIMVIVAPFMSVMSETIERKSNQTYSSQSFSLPRFMSDLLRGFRIAIGNLVKELGLTIGIFLLGLFPLFTIVTPVLLFLVQSYYAGFGNIDYYLERHASVRESKRFVRRNKGLAIGNGAVFMLLLLIPVLGLFLAPALGTVAATTQSMKRFHHY